MKMDFNLKFPHKIRKNVQPLGKLISGKREKTIPNVENFFKDYISKNSNIEVYIPTDFPESVYETIKKLRCRLIK